VNPHNQEKPIKYSLTITPSVLALVAPFVAVASHRSFAAAARNAGVSPSAMSQAISRLETELGVELLVRTTRSVNLTEAGLSLYQACQPALRQIHDSMAGLGRGALDVEGTLRLNVPRLACSSVLPGLLRAVHEKHPHLVVDVVVDDRNVNIVEAGFDAGIRTHEEIERDMLAVRLSRPFRFLTVASPDYFERLGTPQHPRDLVRHVCLPWRSPTTGSSWRWEYREKGRPLHVGVNGPVSSTDGEFLVSCARAGLGLTYACEPQVTDDLNQGNLMSTLESYSVELAGLFLYYPKSSHRNPRLAAFVACARQHAAETQQLKRR
jgi:DNA-binding transcriptional LysR family regulator